MLSVQQVQLKEQNRQRSMEIFVFRKMKTHKIRVKLQLWCFDQVIVLTKYNMPFVPEY